MTAGKPETTIEPSEVDGWENVSNRMSDGGYVVATWPKDRVTVLARPGMVVSCAEFEAGRIETITPDFCIVRYPNGDAQTFRWGEVQLQNVQPDPAFLPPPSGSLSMAEMEKAVRALMVGRHGPDVLEEYPLVNIALEKDGEHRGDTMVIDVTDELAEMRKDGAK